MCLSSSYYFISIYLFEQFNVVSKPRLNILNYLQGCGVQMPNTAVLEKSLPALARTCMPEQREQCSSAQISLVHPSPAGGQGESLLTAWGFILSMGSHSNTPAMEGRAEQSCRAWREELVCEQTLGRLLSHHRVRLQAKSAHRPRAKPEVCSTCGFHRNRENMGRDHKHSGIPGLLLPWQEHHGIAFP